MCIYIGKRPDTRKKARRETAERRVPPFAFVGTTALPMHATERKRVRCSAFERRHSASNPISCGTLRAPREGGQDEWEVGSTHGQMRMFVATTHGDREARPSRPCAAHTNWHLRMQFATESARTPRRRATEPQRWTGLLPAGGTKMRPPSRSQTVDKGRRLCIALNNGERSRYLAELCVTHD